MHLPRLTVIKTRVPMRPGRVCPRQMPSREVRNQFILPLSFVLRGGLSIRVRELRDTPVRTAAAISRDRAHEVRLELPNCSALQDQGLLYVTNLGTEQVCLFIET